ncbi:X-linked retinitis pigmentosa GTPase regulator-interacting protein 1 [Spea bombifrons]|uniref:X-linked retinitis pigmentosa GTPase regulator-interacting protein 1 n=1 Tax=Spea bombifrons TaxID=233779 RepID=UPI00234B6FA3|nr:X-linked retinitis pigmentosa GTPase regulator-interacting protein 1 [Spea bombifrons]
MSRTVLNPGKQRFTSLEETVSSSIAKAMMISQREMLVHLQTHPELSLRYTNGFLEWQDPQYMFCILEKDLRVRRRVSLISREELEDKFLHLHEENLLLKDYARKQEDKIKRMATKLLRLTSELGQTGESKTVSSRRDGRDLEAEETIEDLQDRVRDLERRNESLRNRLTTYKQRLQIQEVCRHCPYSTVTARINSGVRRNTALPEKTKRGLRVQGLEKSIPHVSIESYGDALSDEARAEIDQLFHVVESQNHKVDERSAMLLKNTETARHKYMSLEVLHSLQQMQQAEDHRAVLRENVIQIRLQKELREKNASLCALREQFQQLKESYETELEEKQKSLILSNKAVLTQLEDLSSQLKEERAKVVALELEKQSVLNLQKSLLEFQERVGDVEKEKELIKQHYENLLKSTLDSDCHTSWQETEKELRNQISDLDNQNRTIMSEHMHNKERVLHERELNEQLKREVSQLQIQLLEKIDEVHRLEEKVSSILSSRATRDHQNKEETSHRMATPEKANYVKLTEMNKPEKRGDEETGRTWEIEKNVDQTRKVEDTRHKETMDNGTEKEEKNRREEEEKEMLRKIHRMDAAHAETILELDKTREMLLLQHKINNDYQEELQTLRLRAENGSREKEETEQVYKARLLQRESKIQKLEAQLKDIAYGTYPPRAITKESPSSDEDISFTPVLHRGETLFEIHIGGICFSPHGLRRVCDPEPVTFCIYSFYDFETHATPVVNGAQPQYNFTSSYAVIPIGDFLHYLRVGTLTVELYQVIGGEHCELARARISLEATLQSRDRVYRTTILTDTSGEIIGELDYWLHLHGPLSQTQHLQKQRNKAISYLSTHKRGAMPKTILSTATDGPQNVLIIRIWGCKRLWGGRIGYQPSPYAVYQFYHHKDHTTSIIPCSSNPQFGDEAFYPLHLTTDLERYLLKERLYVYVFDDEETQPGGYLGKVEVPLLALAQGKSIQGDFALMDPNGKCTGSAQVSLEWKFPYQAPGKYLWESVTNSQTPPEKPLEGAFSQSKSLHLSKTDLGKPRPPKSRKVEENLQWDHHFRKRGKSNNDGQVKKPNGLVAVHQSEEFDMDVEEITPEPEELKKHMMEEEPNEVEHSSSLYPNIGKEEPHLPLQWGEQATDYSDSQSTESDDIIIIEPQFPRKPPSSRIRVEIASLTLDPYSEVASDESVQRVFVEFCFPGVPREETETPMSLRKPGRGEEIYFHFSKVIHLDGVEYAERRQFLYMLLEGSDDCGERNKLRFTVVSDPINEEQEECRNLGYAYLGLQFLMMRSVDIVEETLQIVDVMDQSQVIGALRVAIEAKDAARTVYREKRTKLHSSLSSSLNRH